MVSFQVKATASGGTEVPPLFVRSFALSPVLTRPRRTGRLFVARLRCARPPVRAPSAFRPRLGAPAPLAALRASAGAAPLRLGLTLASLARRALAPVVCPLCGFDILKGFRYTMTRIL